MVSVSQASSIVSRDQDNMAVQKGSRSESGISGSHGFDPLSGVGSGSDGQGSATA